MVQLLIDEMKDGLPCNEVHMKFKELTRRDISSMIVM